MIWRCGATQSQPFVQASPLNVPVSILGIMQTLAPVAPSQQLASILASLTLDQVLAVDGRHFVRFSKFFSQNRAQKTHGK